MGEKKDENKICKFCENYFQADGDFCCDDCKYSHRIAELEKQIEDLKARESWKFIESEGLPDDNEIYWVAYIDFYGNKKLGKGIRDKNLWVVSRGHKIPIESIYATMLYVTPELPAPARGE